MEESHYGSILQIRNIVIRNLETLEDLPSHQIHGTFYLSSAYTIIALLNHLLLRKFGAFLWHYQHFYVVLALSCSSFALFRVIIFAQQHFIIFFRSLVYIWSISHVYYIIAACYLLFSTLSPYCTVRGSFVFIYSSAKSFIYL